MASVDPQATIDTERYEVTRTVHIRATPERVWDALTRDDLIAQWFGSTADLPDLRVGGTGTFGFEGYGEFPVRIEEYDEPVVFAFTWGSPGEPLRADNSTLVRFTLVADGDATLLTVVESGFDLLARDPLVAMEDNRGGWTAELDELVTLLEGAT
ncbi:SRPBCC domain-containing protein [Cellulomonas sp.]|uniref:SRPBCC domain-containing protein n=1 Tax=Cellulomonas sp. TaxID=40001 RepID=UPI003BACE32D